MRQHPIPQNILDIEFKLFGKFTVKEFVYIAIGVSIGGLFLYFWTEGLLSGFIAWMIFILFAGTGAFLGLVPINDQPADQFISNYINAITHPTQRVWQNEGFKDKLESMAQARGLKPQEITMDKKGQDTQKRIESEKDTPENKSQQKLDAEEEQKLKNIDVLFEETGLNPYNEKKKKYTKEAEVKEEQKKVKTKPTKEDAKNTQSQAQNNQNQLSITKENIDDYKVDNIDVQLSGTINMILNSKQNQPIPQATAIFKDKFDKPVLAMKSGKNGEVLTNKILGKGQYKIEIHHEQYNFPQIYFLVEKDIYPIIKIKAL